MKLDTDRSQIEGRNPILEALRSGRVVHRIILSKDVENNPTIVEIVELARKKKAPLEFVHQDVIRSRAKTSAPQGIIAFVAPKTYLSLEHLIGSSKEKNPTPFFVMLDGLEDPHNLGAILRTADAAGVDGVIIPERRSVQLTDTVAKVSVGAIEYVPVARVGNLNNAIKMLKDEGFWVIGIDEDGTTLHTSIDYKHPTTIVIGGEGKGVSRLVKENCHEVAKIPMYGQISSLNASVAAAVIMYEAVRQRKGL
jgi:23S rRNA (guanosine2251-2'-O)-methyltransferase